MVGEEVVVVVAGGGEDPEGVVDSEEEEKLHMILHSVASYDTLLLLVVLKLHFSLSSFRQI